MEIHEFLRDLIEQGEFENVARDTFAQFGPANREYVGAQILPERLVNENVYRETDIRIRTVIALDANRFSPPQMREAGQMFSTMLVELGDSDIARQFTGRDYDALIDYLDRNVSMEAAALVVGWSESALNAALIEVNELHIWEALLNAQVVLKGDWGQNPINYINPTGHRINAGGDWSDDTYDPMTDILAQVELLRDKGYTVSRIVTSSRVLATLRGNKMIATRSGKVVEIAGSEFTSRVTNADITQLLAEEGLPPIQTYDLRYWTQTASYRFFPENAMFFAAQTGRDQAVVSLYDPEDVRFLQDTLGYLAVGRPAGRTASGRTIYVEQRNSKPPCLYGEMWQTSLPVIQDPEALAAIKNITLS